MYAVVFQSAESSKGMRRALSLLLAPECLQHLTAASDRRRRLCCVLRFKTFPISFFLFHFDNFSSSCPIVFPPRLPPPPPLLMLVVILSCKNIYRVVTRTPFVMPKTRERKAAQTKNARNREREQRAREVREPLQCNLPFQFFNIY